MKNNYHKIAYSLKYYSVGDQCFKNLCRANVKVLAAMAIFFMLNLISSAVLGQAASSNYATQTGTLGTTYSWIDCSGGTIIVSGDDAVASFSWPFTFSFYDNTYTTANSLSVTTNGFIRLDGIASADYGIASSYSLSSSSTELGQIIATSVYDCNVGGTGWVKYVVTGSAPNRILTIEYNNVEIDYNDNKYADVQVSFYETSNKIVLKLGTDNVSKSGIDMGLHSGVSGYYNKWQEVQSGTNDTWIEYTRTTDPPVYTGPQASWNYATQTGTTGSTYSWIDCSGGSTIVSGDDEQASINWPFNFNFYDNAYTTSNSLSVATNGFIRLDGVASTDYNAATAYNLTSTATNLGQIIAMAVYDGKVGDNNGWVKSLLSGTAPNRIFTIEYKYLEIDYNDNKYANVQVSFYESTNKIVLKLGTDDINKSGVDMGLHSGVNTFFNKWQEVQSGIKNTWIEYTPPNIEVNATIGTSIAYYPTLKNAFDKINDGTHQGNLVVKINQSTTESASAVLNASGSGSSNYSSVNIYPTVSGLSINGNLSSPLIDFNGADNVTIDGRVNATGSTADLTIVNSMVSGTSNTSTIRFINSATNNTIQYCTVKGGATGPYTAILLFVSSNTGSGNSNNRVENCNLTGLDASNRPYAVVYSYGTTGRENSNNSISNNNIYDFFNVDATSYGIYIYQYSSDWTIEGNSFYETTDFVPTGNAYYYAVRVSNTAGNNFSIANNYFGGQEALCAGDAFKMSTSLASRFYAIHLDVGTDTPSSVQGNTIQNFDFSSSNSIIWMGIDANSGAVNIGTESGNTIGAATGNSSVLLTKSGSTLASKSYGIYVNSSGTVVISNNTIGSVTTTNSANLNPHSFYGIYKEGGKSGSLVVSHNLVGSETTSNSIQAATSCTSGSAQDVYGIMSSASGTTLISENTVANLFNAYAYQWADKGQVAGIYTNQGINTIQYNTVRNLTCTSPSSSTTGNAAVIGIAQQSTAAGQTITGNTVYGLNSTYDTGSEGVNVIGIYYFGGTSGTNSITNNFIHSLDASITDAALTGIKVYAGTTTIANNIISLGVGVTTGLTTNGLYENGNAGNDNSVWFNSIYIGGTASGTTASTYALYSATNNNGRDFRNNILINARTGGTTGKHYAIRIAGTSNLTIDYNDYFISGSPSVLGLIGSTDQATFTNWQTATSQDVNSLNTDPGFTSAGGTDFSNYVTSAALPGATGTGILTDYDGVIRNSTPKMGALETSLSFVWQGGTSTDFSDVDNWVDGVVPPDGADISFAALPDRDCYLDQNRILHEITNESDKILVVNGMQLTIKGAILSAKVDQIHASAASSEVIFEGDASQNIPSGVFVSNTIDALTLNNEHGLTQNGDLIISTGFTLTNGDFTIGANTLTLNGSVTKTAGTLSGGSSSNIVIGGSGASTTLPAITLNNLTLNRSNGINLSGNVTVGGTLALTAGTLSVGANVLTVSGSSVTSGGGTVDVSNVSAALVFNNAVTITLPATFFSGAVNNLTISGAGGLTAASDITVNGILNLAAANPSDTKGLLEMTIDYTDYPGTTISDYLNSHILNMGANSTTIGPGDVTGTIKRATIVANTPYSFGNQYTTISLTEGTMPTALAVTITIGTSPGLSTPTDDIIRDAIKRTYEIVPTGGSDCYVTANFHYLDSELQSSNDPYYTNTEQKLTTMDYDIDIGGHGFLYSDEHGRANYDYTNNYIGLSSVPISYFIQIPETHEWRTIFTLRDYGVGYFTWNGSQNTTDWDDVDNWTVGVLGSGVPTTSGHVIIPDAASTGGYSPALPTGNTIINTISIENGGVLTMGSNTLTLQNSFSGGWEDQNPLGNDPGTSTVIFDLPPSYDILPHSTISGNARFYNVEIKDGVEVTNQTNAHVKISGSVTRTGTGKWFAGIFPSTVEYNNDGAQTVVIPDGSPNYYKLVLSGSGTKTMPTSAMSIADEFKLTGSVTATAQQALTIGGELEIINGGTFITGDFNHAVGGHFDVGGHGGDDGTFTPSPGYSITLNGTDVQNIYGESEITFKDLVIDNSAGVDVSTDVTIDGELTLTNGNLNVGETNLTINSGLTKTSGFINVNSSSSLTFGEETSALTLPASLFYGTPSVNNLTVNRTGGVVMNSNITVNGALILESANPASGTIGTLNMGTNTLNMGENATTTGIGDVTGIIKREHTFNGNVEYAFGNQNTSLTFINTGTKPGWVSCKVSIGTSPAWRSLAVKREYSFAKDAGTDKTIVKLHYLDSELNSGETDESKLVLWDHHNLPTADYVTEPHGKSGYDATDNWVERSSMSISYLAPSATLDDKLWGFSYTNTDKIIWTGLDNTGDWSSTGNWNGGVPTSDDDVLIPAGLSTPYPYTNLNPGTVSAVAKTIEIETGASITVDTYDITVYGSSGAWINNGTFVPGTGTVFFDNTLATISGTTNFYNVTINSGKSLRMEDHCVMRIAGAIENHGDWHVVTTANSTVEYNGGNQTVIAPNTTTRRYNDLILSGTGTKTMPGTALNIEGDFTISGSASVTAADSIIVLGNTTIGSGSAFTTGAQIHILQGNFENNGTLTATSDGDIIFNGTLAQTISGSSTTSFDNLTIDNLEGIIMESDINVNNVLTLNDGKLNVGANTLGINGTISNPSGHINLSSTSNLSFGGTSAITLNNHLFDENPEFNNLTINRSGGVTLGDESLTVNGTMTLTTGTFTIGANTLMITGNSPVRTSGNINSSDAEATLAFENATAITLPSSVFSAYVNNLTISGAGGITAGDDITVNGVLDLQGANPSTTKGILDMSSYTLDMGEDATTIGQGDVSGIIRRTSILPNTTYSFGNQYSTISFPDVGTLPTEISLKVTLGSAPSWRTGAIKRKYDLIQTGGSGTQALIKNHYLDSELNGNDESLLGEWMYIFAQPLIIDYGRSGNNTNENWITISNVNIGVFSDAFGDVEIAMDEYENTELTWNGSTSTSWVTASNWTPMGAPSDETVITIPDAATTPNDPIIPEIAVCGKIIIESGGILNSKSGGQLTITGADSAWVNNGTFNPETGIVIFSNDDETETVKITGTTNFNSLTLANKTWLQPATNSIINIAGQINADSRCILDFGTNANTIAYNGSKAQDVIDPGEGYAYYNLALSGSGTKKLPDNSIQIIGDFNLSGSATTTSYFDLTVGADLLLSNSAGLTIDAGKTLTVTGTTTNTVGVGGLVLLSTIDGTASLIHNSDNVPATMQRYISGNAEDWHFLSSPVSNQNISGDWLPSGTYGNGTGYDLYVWDEPTNCWIYNLNTTTTVNWNTVHTSSNFVPGRGYLYSVQASNPTKEFAGNLNNGDQAIPITYSSAVDSLKGFNLVGNPYPSSIDWKNATGWTRNNLLASGSGYDMWIWNPAAGNYGVFNSDGLAGSGTNEVTQYIAPMQGFFVRASSSGNLGMTNDVRVHDETNNWKSAVAWDKVKIRIESNAEYGFDEVLLQFGSSTNQPGAAKLFSPDKLAPTMFIPFGGDLLSVLYLTNTEENSLLPLTFKAGSNGDYTFSADFILNDFDCFILEDKKTGDFYDLKENNQYHFASSTKDNANRFVLHFEPITEEKTQDLPANIYSSGDYLVLDLTMVDEYTSVKIVDVLGRTILQESVSGNEIHRFPINGSSQVYIVYAKTRNAYIVKKVFVQ